MHYQPEEPVDKQQVCHELQPTVIEDNHDLAPRAAAQRGACWLNETRSLISAFFCACFSVLSRVPCTLDVLWSPESRKDNLPPSARTASPTRRLENFGMVSLCVATWPG